MRTNIKKIVLHTISGTFSNLVRTLCSIFDDGGFDGDTVTIFEFYVIDIIMIIVKIVITTLADRSNVSFNTPINLIL